MNDYIWSIQCYITSMLFGWANHWHGDNGLLNSRTCSEVKIYEMCPHKHGWYKEIIIEKQHIKLCVCSYMNFEKILISTLLEQTQEATMHMYEWEIYEIGAFCTYGVS